MIKKTANTTLTLTVEGETLDEPVLAKPAPGRKPRRATAQAQAVEATASQTDGDNAASAQANGETSGLLPVFGKTGGQASDEVAKDSASSDASQATPAPKRRGRPPKNPRPDTELVATAPVAVSKKSRSADLAAAGSNGAASAGANGSNNGGAYQQAQQGQQPQWSSQQGQQNNQSGSQQAQQARRQRRQPNNAREIVPSVTREDLAELKIGELREKAAELSLDISDIRKKDDLVDAVLAAAVKAEGFIDCEGIFDLISEGYGFLRTTGYLPGETDVYVGMAMVRRNGLRKGDYVRGQVRPARDNEKFAALHRIDSVNGLSLDELQNRPRFTDLTPVYPDERLLMEHGQNTITARTIDLVAPIGKGQRGLIVSPPKAGKTTILKDIAAAISANAPEVHLMCLLVDERPEEVTDMERSIKGEVVSSTFDMPSENHIAVAELVIERAKRLVETGRDVVILLDSITRLARAYNLAQPASGRILSGGVDSTALYPPKRFLGAARNIEGGGSLTILASALIDTGSKMDEVIFEEFKGTGNMELKLDRDLADRRVFPAIDPISSGTRKEELLLDTQEAPLIWAVRRILANMNNTERAMEMLIKSLKQTRNNAEFLMRTAKKAQQKNSSESTDL